MLEVANRMCLFTYILIKCETPRKRIITRIKAIVNEECRRYGRKTGKMQWKT
jgi:hypothetical protein